MEYFNQLIKFEEENKFLYEIKINDCCVYTMCREGLLNAMQCSFKSLYKSKEDKRKNKTKIVLKRIIDSIFGLLKVLIINPKVLIFTSSQYRRDYNKNLAVEWLKEKSPEAIIFEWPSKNVIYDKGYLNDTYNKDYIPLDFFIIIFKIYRIFNKRNISNWEDECRKILIDNFTENNNITEYIIRELPRIYSETKSLQYCSKLYLRFLSPEFVIDFFGAARENFFVGFSGNPKLYELQHGVIFSEHTGYIYPEFVKEIESYLFKRNLLVYGLKTKEILVNQSIFEEDQITVIGNPRIKMYKKISFLKNKNKKYILFSSQPVSSKSYYNRMIEYMIYINNSIKDLDKDNNFQLVVKLHPRENYGVFDFYKENLPDDVLIITSDISLYELLQESWLQFTYTSTTLYEAALFNVPTITLRFKGWDIDKIYGFKVLQVETEYEVKEMMQKMLDEKNYLNYSKYLKIESEKFM